MAKITVQDTTVTVIKKDEADYISLTDIPKYKTTDANVVSANWLRNRMTIEYLGLWEILYNPSFTPPPNSRGGVKDKKDRLIKLNQIAIR